MEIRLHPAELERYRLEERTAPLPYRTSGILDTGAQKTCVLASIVENLPIDPVDQVDLITASGTLQSAVYSLSLQLGLTLDRLPNPIEVLAHTLPRIQGAELLIGLDVLQQVQLTIFGPESRFELTLP